MKGSANVVNLDELVEVEQLDIAARLAPLSVVTSVAVTQVIIWLTWTHGVQIYLVFLELATIGVSGLALAGTIRWRAEPKPARIDPTRLFLYRAAALAGGVTLGTIPMTLFADADQQVRSAIMATCAGLIATGMSLSAMPRLAFLFSGPIVIGSFIGLATTGDGFYISVAILLVVYAFFLSFLTVQLARLITKRVVDRIELERERALTAQLLQDFEANADDWLWETDSAFRLAHVSDRLAEAFGCARSHLQGANFLQLLERHVVEGSRATLVKLREKIEAGEAFRDAMLRVRLAGGDRWWRLAGKPVVIGADVFSGYRGVGSDVTEKREADDRVAHLATHDALTNLPNRVSFQNRLDLAIEGLARGERFAVLCLDLDDFKAVNDSFGHGVGDALLKLAAARMRTLLSPRDFLVRLAGDEFVILRTGPGAGDRATIAALGARIIASIGEPFPLDGISAHIGVSIGVALAPEDGTRETLRRADLALYQSKRLGKNSLHFYHADMDELVSQRRALAADLRNALAHEEFSLVFQPQVNAATHAVQGFEALLRWNHKTRGLVSPVEFIPLAEETGAIIPIGEWALREACRTAAQWPRGIKVAVNVSPIQFRFSELPKMVEKALADSGLEAHRLELELTESALLENSHQTQSTLHALRALGVRLSLDDFGTGYSSLSYLRQIPFDRVKIDRCFVQDLPQNARDLSIVRAIVDIATAMGMSITAEGVETEEQSRCLLQQGCHQLQGYLFSKPVSTAAAAELVGGATAGQRQSAA
ncbi:MAG: EAL domain-containing protein [Methylobacteriaceae bacterium]|nr:EAL domain-containing protein [Methylobacteriaceae bacterium]